MPLIDAPISQRAGYREKSKADALQRDLNALTRKHRLLGCVLVQFTKDLRVGVRSCGVTDEFCRAMDTLGARILTDIDDGRHEPLEQIDAEGNG